MGFDTRLANKILIVNNLKEEGSIPWFHPSLRDFKDNSIMHYLLWDCLIK
jgi:hypothetical protein